MHVACLAVFLPGIQLTLAAGILFAVFYAVRVFGLTAGYHRYFAHRAYKTSRAFQFLLALMGCSALQRGPLWWAGHHRHHHRFSDTEEDVHSPIQDTFWHSHVGWIFDDRWDQTPYEQIHDFAKYPELRFLEKHHWVPGIAVAVLCVLIGGWSGLVYGFFLSTVAVYHVTFMVNSLCHVWGKRKYPTTDYSKNNPWIALLTFGEGWHNNHHHYQSSANQGFFWWEFDISYSVLKALSWVDLVWELRTPPAAKRTRPALVPAPTEVAPAVSRQGELETQTPLPPIAAQSYAAAAQAYAAPVFAAASAYAAPVMAAAHSASEHIAAAAQAAHGKVSSAAETMKAAAAAAGESVAAAAHVLEEKVSSAAHSASESMKLAAQAASESMKAAGDSMKAAAQSASDAMAASPAMTAAAVAAAPVVIVVSQVSQST